MKHQADRLQTQTMFICSRHQVWSWNKAHEGMALCLSVSQKVKRLQKLALSFGIEDDHYDSDEELSGEEILQDFH